MNAGGDRSVKIKSLEAAKIMKIKWLVLGCIEADFCKKIRWKALDEIYKIYMLLHRSDLNISANFHQTLWRFQR